MYQFDYAWFLKSSVYIYIYYLLLFNKKLINVLFKKNVASLFNVSVYKSNKE